MQEASFYTPPSSPSHSTLGADAATEIINVEAELEPSLRLEVEDVRSSPSVVRVATVTGVHYPTQRGCEIELEGVFDRDPTMVTWRYPLSSSHLHPMGWHRWSGETAAGQRLRFQAPRRQFSWQSYLELTASKPVPAHRLTAPENNIMSISGNLGTASADSTEGATEVATDGESVLRAGSFVMLTGLTTAPELNGQMGVINGRRGPGGRFPVALVSGLAGQINPAPPRHVAITRQNFVRQSTRISVQPAPDAVTRGLSHVAQQAERLDSIHDRPEVEQPTPAGWSQLEGDETVLVNPQRTISVVVSSAAADSQAMPSMPEPSASASSSQPARKATISRERLTVIRQIGQRFGFRMAKLASSDDVRVVAVDGGSASDGILKVNDVIEEFNNTALRTLDDPIQHIKTACAKLQFIDLLIFRGSTIQGAGAAAKSDGLGPLPSGWDEVQHNGRPLYVHHETKKTQWARPKKEEPPPAPQLDMFEPLPSEWDQKLLPNGRWVFMHHKTKKTQWEDPRLTKGANKAGKHVDVNTTRFQTKLTKFRASLPPKESVGSSRGLTLAVKRDWLLASTKTALMRMNKDKLRNGLYIKFEGEAGLDYGGLQREFFYLISHEIFHPYQDLFEYAATDNYTLQINPSSSEPHHLAMYHFIGRIIGLSIFNGRLLDAYFIR